MTMLAMDYSPSTRSLFGAILDEKGDTQLTKNFIYL